MSVRSRPGGTTAALGSTRQACPVSKHTHIHVELEVPASGPRGWAHGSSHSPPARYSSIYRCCGRPTGPPKSESWPPINRAKTETTGPARAFTHTARKGQSDRMLTQDAGCSRWLRRPLVRTRILFDSTDVCVVPQLSPCNSKFSSDALFFAVAGEGPRARPRATVPPPRGLFLFLWFQLSAQGPPQAPGRSARTISLHLKHLVRRRGRPVGTTRRGRPTTPRRPLITISRSSGRGDCLPSGV